jgi:hypothetical protein
LVTARWYGTPCRRDGARLSLRVVQELAAGKGNTIVLGLDAGTAGAVSAAAGVRRSRGASATADTDET